MFIIILSISFNKNNNKLFNLINKTIILKDPNKDANINLLNLISLFNKIDTEYKIKKSQKKLIKRIISIYTFTIITFLHYKKRDK
jgi:hypothetical protein